MISANLRTEVEQFLYAEVGFLDERRYEEWLGLLDKDIIYWIPNFDENGSPAENGVIVREDLVGLRARVARLGHRQNPTQKPAARTLHILSNIRVFDGAAADTVDAAANLLLHVSKDQRQSRLAGKVNYKLRHSESGWRMVLKKIYLIDNDVALGQLPLM